MIGIINNTDVIKYNEIFELTRAFIPDEDLVEAPNYELDKEIYLENNNEQFLVRTKGISPEPGTFSASEIDVNIHRGKEATSRIAAKRAIYLLLSKVTGKKLPWGILTGIRPIKIAAALMEKGISKHEILYILANGYFIDAEKAELATRICSVQYPFIESFKGKTFSLYIGILFCPTRCVYCSFPSLSASKYRDKMGIYVNALMVELEGIKELMNGWRLDSVYIGGGTPTSLPKELMRILIEEVYRLFPGSYELTVEAGRPDTLDEAYLSLLKELKVERISINPQTMNLRTLKAIGRDHTPEDIIKTYNLTKELGIRIVNMDIIVGLPGEELIDIKNTLNEIKKLKPENLTVHTLSVKKGSKLIEDKESKLTSEADKIGEMLNISRQFAYEMGLEPYYLYRQKLILGNYENIGYSKPDNPCRYNIAIMEEKQTIIAAGMGAISKIYNEMTGRITRIPNPKDLESYCDRVDEFLAKRLDLINQVQMHED